MQHLHDDALTFLALGETATDEEQSHLDQCPHCRADLASFSRVVNAARRAGTTEADDGGRPASNAPERGGPADAALPSPDPSVWAGIHRALDLDDEVREDPLATPAAAVPTVAAARRRRTGTWLAAAAAAVVVAAAGTWGALRTLDPAPEPEAVASAELVPLAASSGTGSAVVDQLPDGRRELVVTSSSDVAQGYREVWLLAPDAKSMVSLGRMEGVEGRFELPSDLDLGKYPVVDISDEPYDGNPAHSGESLLRGQLEL